MKNKIKKLRKRINRKVKQFNDLSSDEETDDEIEQIKPYVIFTQSLQSRFGKRLINWTTKPLL